MSIARAVDSVAHDKHNMLWQVVADCGCNVLLMSDWLTGPEVSQKEYKSRVAARRAKVTPQREKPHISEEDRPVCFACVHIPHTIQGHTDIDTYNIYIYIVTLTHIYTQIATPTHCIQLLTVHYL